jgi:hypothetical protein
LQDEGEGEGEEQGEGEGEEAAAAETQQQQVEKGEVVLSLAHGINGGVCEINVSDCVKFIMQDRAAAIGYFRRSFVYRDHLGAVRQMAEAAVPERVCLQMNARLIFGPLSPECRNLRQALMSGVLPAASNTHRIEAMVRRSKLASAAANRSEASASEVAMEMDNWLGVKEQHRDEKRAQQAAAGQKETRGSASSATITAHLLDAAFKHALGASELRELRKREKSQDSSTQERQKTDLVRMRRRYAEQVMKTHEPGRRAPAAQKSPSAPTLTIQAAGIPGAQKISCRKKDTEGGLDVVKAVAELRYRSVQVLTEGVRPVDLRKTVQNHLEELKDYALHPGYFKYTMPGDTQDAYDRLARVRRMLLPDLKAEAGLLSLAEAGTVSELVSRITERLVGRQTEEGGEEDEPVVPVTEEAGEEDEPVVPVTEEEGESESVARRNPARHGRTGR